MKRILFFFGALAVAVFVTGMFREQTRSARAAASALRDHEISITNELVRFEIERQELRREAAHRAAQQRAASPAPLLDTALADWLIATNYAKIPRGVVPGLRAALGLPWNDSTDYVLVSKATLNDLIMPAISREDKLSRPLCGVLQIEPEAQQQIESVLSQIRREYTDWARTNLQRTGPSGDTLFRYEIPASPEQAHLWTNALSSAFQSALGVERAEVLEKDVAADWIRFHAGFLGATFNQFEVFKRVVNGKPELFYRLNRGNGSGESGRIAPNRLHPTLQNIFPGGWPEIAEREKFELPEGPPASVPSTGPSRTPELRDRQAHQL